MNKLIIFLVFIFPIVTFSQTYTVEYNVYLNSLERNGTLYFIKNGSSFYFETAKTKSSEKTNEIESGVIEQKIVVGNSKKNVRYQIYLSQKDTLKNIDYINDKQVVSFETFPKMTWEISDEIKTISNYKCNKATTIFRGRKYTAWFSSELPIHFGPWKFTGLPGLIFEIYDETKAFSWYVSKINLNQESIPSIPGIANLEKLSFKEFIIKDEQSKKDLTNQMMLKYIDRGAEIVGSEYNRGRETVFEWEK